MKKQFILFLIAGFILVIVGAMMKIAHFYPQFGDIVIMTGLLCEALFLGVALKSILLKK